MNTVRIESMPNNYVRCTMEDQSTVTMEHDKLYEWLREHPMQEPAPKPWYSRLFNFSKE